MNNKELVRQLSTPPSGSRDLQFKSCLWKQNLSYWRSPSYNLMRILHTLAASLLFGILYWNQGMKIDNQQNLFNIFGSLYGAVIFLGINNCSSGLSYFAMERTVMYREKFAGMYFPWAYALAQVTVEIPYLLVQAVTYVIVTYPMIGYYGSAYKIFWNFYGMSTTLLFFNYLGMVLVSLTPNFMIASILSSVFYTLFNLFAGFVIPQPKIPKLGIWLYYLTPTSWTLNGMLTSQYGDTDKETKPIGSFLEDYFGFHHDRLAITAVVLITFPVALASLFLYFIGRLNFLRR